jgi:hypothetical protein
MDSPRKPLFWIWSVTAVLAAAGGAAYLGSQIAGWNAAIALIAYAGAFLLLVVVYATPAHRMFARPTFFGNIAITLIFVAPTAILHIWLAFSLDIRAAPAVWFAPFMGLATGLNIRTLLGKKK